MRTIGVATCGGDAPGMNAAIRAITRIACTKNLKVLGFENGWNGLITNAFRHLLPHSVMGILHTGGTILRTSRSLEFRTEEGIKKAAETLANNNVDGLVVIGGNGSFNGALALSKETDTKIIGIPATIDNDVFGTNETIGFDTAVDTAVVAVDKIRDTMVSFKRVFVIEVMGRERGFIAATVGLAVGAEIVLVPEIQFDKNQVFKSIKEKRAKGKRSGIIVAAEGIGDCQKLAQEIEENTGAETRRSVLGYIQRGGNPSARSRLLASLFANKAIELLLNEQGNRVVGLQDGTITSIDLETSCKTEKPLELDLVNLASILTR
ncbi:ATP-dependent 6-phosphofructokinase [Candidatus Borrarchaeum sp.]|uniref:ATP-dependent 6-phosphofructokinase n=1 Tax=Candidatus Borrarchaeum sp. TaxID=2846742 RepID=UPI00257E3DF3|nr:ATP-dependent 6-phosphofructokinase [Candidatus Borrarchaeum sp.]